MSTASMNSRNNFVFTDPVRVALFKLAGPMLIGILAITVFNLADTWFVAKLGTNELAAMSLTFPVVMLINGLTLGIGVGLTSIISNKVGAGLDEEVKKYTRDGLALAFILVILFTLLGLATINPLFKAIGADENTLPLVQDYMRIWYLGTAALVLPMVGNAAIRGTGDTRFPALIMTIAALSNFILDPLLIFGPGPFPAWGMKGAAIATVLSRAFTMIASLYVLTASKKMMLFKLPSFSKMLLRWKHVLEVGAIAAIIHIMLPLGAGVLTGIIASNGAEIVAAYGAGTRIEMFAVMVPISMGSGLTVFAGQHWGAQKYDRLRQGIFESARFVLLSGTIIFLVLLIFSKDLSNLFTSDSAVAQPMRLYLWFTMAGMILESFASLASTLFIGVRKPLNALLINSLRMFVFTIPIAWLGNHFFGIPGLFIGMGVAKMFTGTVSILFIKGFNSKLEIINTQSLPA